MQVQQQINGVVEGSSLPSRGFTEACGQQSLGHCIADEAACLSLHPLKPHQTCRMPQGEADAVARPASPCCVSGPCISTPSQVDAAPTLSTDAAGALSDSLADSRPDCKMLDVLQPAGVAPAAHAIHSFPAQHKLRTSAAPSQLAPGSASQPPLHSTAAANSSRMHGSQLLQQLQQVACSLSVATHLQDLGRQYLLLQLLHSIPVTPDLLQASQVGAVVRQVLKQVQAVQMQQLPQEQRQEVGDLAARVAATARALCKRWRAVIRAQVDAADGNALKKACKDNPVTKQRLDQQPGLKTAPLAAVAPSVKDQALCVLQEQRNLRLQQLPLACGHAKSKPTQAAAAATEAVALLHPSKPHKKCGRKQQPFSDAGQQVVLEAQQQHGQQKQTSHVAHSRANKSGRHANHQKQQQQQRVSGAVQDLHGIEPAAKKQKSSRMLQQQQHQNPQQQQSTTKAVASTQQQSEQLNISVHSSWLSALSNGNRDVTLSKPQLLGGATTGAADVSVAHHVPSHPFIASHAVSSTGLGSDQTPQVHPAPAAAVGMAQVNIAPTGTAAASSIVVASGMTANAPAGSSMPESFATPSQLLQSAAQQRANDAAVQHHDATAIACGSSAAAAAAMPHHPSPVAPVVSSKSTGAATSPTAAAAKGQHHVLWGSGALALRAAKIPHAHGHHASHYHGHHGRNSHAADHSRPAPQRSVSADVATAQAVPSAGGHVVSIIQRRPSMAGSSAMEHCSRADCAPAVSPVVNSPIEHRNPGCVQVRAASMGSSAVVFGPLGGSSCGFVSGTASGFKPGAHQVLDSVTQAAANHLSSAEGDEDGAVLVDTHAQHWGSLLGDLDTVGAFVLGPEL